MHASRATSAPMVAREEALQAVTSQQGRRRPRWAAAELPGPTMRRAAVPRCHRSESCRSARGLPHGASVAARAAATPLTLSPCLALPSSTVDVDVRSLRQREAHTRRWREWAAGSNMATRAHLPASATRWWLSVDDLHARHVRTTALIPPDGGLLRSSRASCYSLGSGLTPAESMPCRDELNGRHALPPPKGRAP